MVGYIDYFLVQAKDPVTIRLHTEICILVFHCLGFKFNFSKSTLIPSQRIEQQVLRSMKIGLWSGVTFMPCLFTKKVDLAWWVVEFPMPAHTVVPRGRVPTQWT